MYTDNDRNNNFFESVKKTEVKQKLSVTQTHRFIFAYSFSIIKLSCFEKFVESFTLYKNK